MFTTKIFQKNLPKIQANICNFEGELRPERTFYKYLW